MITSTRKPNTPVRHGGSLAKPVLLVLTLLGFVFSWSMAFGPAAHAQDGPERSAMNADLTIEKGEVVDGDVSVTYGKLIVYGEVHGKVAVLEGSVQIEG